jgi:hypothetical protein
LWPRDSIKTATNFLSNHFNIRRVGQNIYAAKPKIKEIERNVQPNSNVHEFTAKKKHKIDDLDELDFGRLQVDPFQGKYKD